MLQAATLKDFPGIRHAFFTREGGVSSGLYASLNAGLGSNDDADKVRENRRRMAEQLGVSAENFLTCYQIHSPTVIVAETPWSRDQVPQADALVTRKPGLAIGVATADCGPVLFADAEARVVGAAHAGWKGALGGVLEATLDAMEGLGAARGRIRAALGPMIRQSNYEVGPEFVSRLSEIDPANARYLAPSSRPAHAQFDLAGYIGDRLRRAGVGHIEDLGLCTYADPAHFFSYRRMTHRKEADYGRHINAIAVAS